MYVLSTILPERPASGTPEERRGFRTQDVLCISVVRAKDANAGCHFDGMTVPLPSALPSNLDRATLIRKAP